MRPLRAEQGERTISIDEMTGIQALERKAPDQPMRPGKRERREFEYIRHGTQTLIASFDVAAGQKDKSERGGYPHARQTILAMFNSWSQLTPMLSNGTW